MNSTLINGTARRYAALVTLVALLALALTPVFAPARWAAAGLTKPVKGQYGAQSSFNDAKLTVCDVDLDGVDEILAGNLNGYLYCFTPTGGVKWAFYAGAAIRGGAACWDVDGNNNKEIFFGDMAGRVWGLGCNGVVLSHWGWPKQTPNTGGYVGVYGTPAIGDINGDGANDIVVGSYGHYVHAWSFSGGDLPGFPKDTADTIWSSPALADIDRDGLKEIIIGGDSTGGSGWPYPAGGLLWVINGDGSVQPGFPQVTPEVLWSSPACADIDNDGFYEIVIGTGHYYTATGHLSTQGFMVYAYNHDGSMASGWPVGAPGCTMSSPAIGDMDGDGVQEVAIASYPVAGRGADMIMLIHGNGQKMWEMPAFGGPNRASPVLGDVNSDGRADFIMGSGQAIGAWDIWGNCIWNQVLDNFVITTAAYGDFDRDGNMEVACGTGGEAGGGSFFVFDCGPQRASAAPAASTMPWPQFRLNYQHTGAIPTGNEPPPPPPPANFHEYILLMNPGAAAANACITLMNEKGEQRAVDMVVPPTSRVTAFINKYMSGCGVSASVTSDLPIIAERAMYFNFQNKWKGGTDSAGAPAASTTWYLAEGYTASNFDEYVLVQNPQAVPAMVNMAFMREGDAPMYASYLVNPGSRFTLNVKDVPGCAGASVSTKVDASVPVICERSMYFNYNGFVGGHNAMGVTQPQNCWYLAEGYTAQSYDTYVLVQNPGTTTAAVALTLLRGDGYTTQVGFEIPAQGRKTVRLDDIPGFEAAEVSTQVDSNVGVVAERAMYFNSGGRTGGHDSAGVCQTGNQWYLAEGYTGGSFDEYVLVMNPGAAPVTVNTTFMVSNGAPRNRVDMLAPHSRFTIHVDAIPGLENAEVSTLVQSTGGEPIIAERALYFVYNNAWSDGHDAAGVLQPSTTWYFAEGYTGL